MSGLNGMRVEPVEIEFPGNQEYHCSHGVDTVVATRLTFSSLEQTVERFKEAIGLPGLRPSHDAIEMVANHFSDLLHRINLGTHDIGAPLCQQVGNDIDLFTFKNLSKLFAVQPGPGG